MKYKINEYNKINNKVIDDSIFQEQKVDYEIREREDLIDNLIDWISEATKDRDIMKTDLKYLMSIKDRYILSSVLTNEYILEDTNEGQKILGEIYNF